MTKPSIDLTFLKYKTSVSDMMELDRSKSIYASSITNKEEGKSLIMSIVKILSILFP